MAKGKKTGGRVKGTPNKTTQEIIEKAKAGGIMPLDYMLEVMRDKEVPRSERLAAANSAAPYVHSKMPTAIVTPPPPKGPVGKDDLALIDQYLAGVHAEADQS